MALINVLRQMRVTRPGIQVVREYNESRSPLYKNSEVLKFSENIKLLNIMDVFDSLKVDHESVLNNNFTPIHTLSSISPEVLHNIKGLYLNVVKSIRYQSAHRWNRFPPT